MLPVLILVVPPFVAGGGYGSWYLGQQTALSLFRTTKSIDAAAFEQSTGSYIAGLVTLGSMYGLQSSQFYRLEGTTKTNSNTITHTTKKVAKENASEAYIPPHKQPQSKQFQPPKSMSEAFQRMGRPLMMRAGAGGIAFFFSGLVQTLVTSREQ